MLFRTIQTLVQLNQLINNYYNSLIIVLLFCFGITTHLSADWDTGSPDCDISAVTTIIIKEAGKRNQFLHTTRLPDRTNCPRLPLLSSDLDLIMFFSIFKIKLSCFEVRDKLLRYVFVSHLQLLCFSTHKHKLILFYCNATRPHWLTHSPIQMFGHFPVLPPWKINSY